MFLCLFSPEKPFLLRLSNFLCLHLMQLPLPFFTVPIFGLSRRNTFQALNLFFAIFPFSSSLPAKMSPVINSFSFLGSWTIYACVCVSALWSHLNVMLNEKRGCYLKCYLLFKPVISPSLSLCWHRYTTQVYKTRYCNDLLSLSLSLLLPSTFNSLRLLT